MGFRGNISRNTLAEANENRDWRIYADFAQVLTIVLTGYYSYKDYPDKLRRTRYYDVETDKLLTFLLNNFIYKLLNSDFDKQLLLFDL